MTAEEILKFIQASVVRTPVEVEVFDWAYWATLAMAEDPDNAEEIATEGLPKWIVDDLVYRLGEQLSEMAADQVDTPEYRQCVRWAVVAKKLAVKIGGLS